MREEIVNKKDIIQMCGNTKYMPKKDMETCEKYISDGIVTKELIRLYSLVQLEIWGDLVEGDGKVEFKYEEDGKYMTVVGKSVDYEAIVLSETTNIQ